MTDFAGLQKEEPPREFNDRLHEASTRTVMQAPSWLVVFQIQDVFAQTERFNTPGSVAATNWTHRLAPTVKQLDTDPRLWAKAKMFTRAARESGRNGEHLTSVHELKEGKNKLKND